jgi:hypothetical protein
VRLESDNQQNNIPPTCPNCGGNWMTVTQELQNGLVDRMLKCPFCGSTQDLPESMSVPFGNTGRVTFNFSSADPQPTYRKPLAVQNESADTDSQEKEPSTFVKIYSTILLGCFSVTFLITVLPFVIIFVVILMLILR